MFINKPKYGYQKVPRSSLDRGTSHIITYAINAFFDPLLSFQKFQEGLDLLLESFYNLI